MREPTLEEARQEIQGMLDESEKRRNGDLPSTALLLADGESSGLRKALRALEPKSLQPGEAVAEELSLWRCIGKEDAALIADHILRRLYVEGYDIVHESEVKR